jgi:hypothetical protein
MALDVHVLVNGQPQKHLFSIDDEAYALLSPGLALFKKRTGVFLDPYGDTKFSSGLGSLIQSIEESLPTAGATQKSVSVLVAVLKAAESNGDSIVFVGD